MTVMGLLLALIVLAVIFGVVGLAVSALKWLLIIAAVLLIIAVFRGIMARGRGTRI
jgi:hypothetical protein